MRNSAEAKSNIPQFKIEQRPFLSLSPTPANVTYLKKFVKIKIVILLKKAEEHSETEKHCVRTVRYAEAIAREIHLSEKEVDLFGMAIRYHDLGKERIPDDILNKRADLTDEEREIMKKHTFLGFEMIDSDSDENQLLPDLIKTVNISHHEKWDGGGYPYHLEGKNIPLIGRIATIADVFDALTSKRAYKEPWSFERAFNYIKEESGKEFDPDLVDVFLKIKQKIIDIYNETSAVN